MSAKPIKKVDVTPIVDALANLAAAMWLDGIEVPPETKKRKRRPKRSRRPGRGRAK